MPWIENVAAADIPTRFHHEAGPNSMLISIVDPASWRPEAAHEFKERHNFEFLDIEKNDFALDEAMRCSQDQANELVRLLQHALENKMNVVVHCYAGVGRSGMIALRLLVERGANPEDALTQIRKVRPGAVERPAQYEWAIANIK